MNSEKLREKKGNLCFNAFPKFWEAGLKNALKFLEAVIHTENKDPR